MVDRIELRGLRAHGFHGVLASERRDGQQFVVDITVWVATTAAATSDNLCDTVDYAVLADHAVQVVQGPPRNLIETVAADIAAAVLGVDPRITATEVVVHKPDAPLRQAVSDVRVIVSRSRAAPETDGESVR